MMTRSEQIAFNQGVAAVIDLAAQTVNALSPKLIEKPTRYNFAVEALAGLVADAPALMLSLSPSSEPVALRPDPARHMIASA